MFMWRDIIVNIGMDKYMYIIFYYLSIIYLNLFGVKKVIVIKRYWNVAVIILCYHWDFWCSYWFWCLLSEFCVQLLICMWYEIVYILFKKIFNGYDKFDSHLL